MTNKEMLQMLLNTTTEIKNSVSSLEERVSALEEKSTQKPSSKKNSKTKTTKYATKKEAIDAWCEKKGYTEADRKAYGEAKKSERSIKHEAYEMTNKQFKEKVSYKTWREAYEKNLKKLSK